MRILKSILLLVCLAWLLCGCDQKAFFDRLIPHEEANIAKGLLAGLASKDYSSIEKQLDPSVQAPSVHSSLERMAAVFPGGQVGIVATVGSNTLSMDGATTYNLTFEHEYPNAWLLSNVVLQRRDGRLSLLGMSVRPMKQSLEEFNRFTFEGKGVLNYIVFGLVIAVPVFIIYALVKCIKTPIARRKWLWVVFIALGFVQLSLNWTDGSWRLQPASFALLGSGFYRAGPYAPFIFNVTVPLGAIVFLLKRRALVAAPVR